MTTAQAADRLGVSHRRVLQIIREREMPTERIGTTYILRAEDVERYAATRQRPGWRKGRLRKPAAVPRGREEGDHGDRG